MRPFFLPFEMSFFEARGFQSKKIVFLRVKLNKSEINMKKFFAVLFLAAIATASFSCARECVCTGSHPSSNLAVEEHSYGKMTTKECQDKQYRMNTDTLFATNKTWVCEN